jgi:hypothetical protein
MQPQPYPGSSYPDRSYPDGSYPAGSYSGNPARFGDTGAYPAIGARPFPAASMPGAAPYQSPYQSPYRAPMVVAEPVPAPPPLEGRRQALLAALVYNPLMLGAYLLYLYGPGNSCVAGPFCSFGELPTLVQAILLLLGAALLWMLITVGVRWLLDATPWHSWFARGVRAVTEYRLVRPLFGVYGAAILVGLLVGLFMWRLTPAALIIGSFTSFVCLRCALGRVPVAPPVVGMSASGYPRPV